MTPKRKKFENPYQYASRGHRFTCCSQILWKSTVGKLTKWCFVYGTKKLTCHPFIGTRVLNLVWISWRFSELLPKES